MTGNLILPAGTISAPSLQFSNSANTGLSAGMSAGTTGVLSIDTDAVELYTFDISSRVNLHVEMARRNAALGQSYTVRLPWYSDGRWTDDFRAKFTAYWQQLGSRIGQPVAPIPVPQGSPGFATRAVKIRPDIVNRITPVDMNIVYQRLPLAPEQRFDLIIGTNIFLYYGGFEQALARVNIASKPTQIIACSR